MKTAPLPATEQERQAALLRYHVLDTAPEPGFDDLTRLASQICGTPISLISLLDGLRQWFKSRCGFAVPEAPRGESFCGHAILQSELFLVEDAAQDERFADNPLVVGEPH
ncbi:MAG TPA: GAF domain-containing protein, partial [Candidatus Saccharimonadales bacterium]|nr:GAF domain-containing protein [Candidatus Saccharimonadales bacterium]